MANFDDYGLLYNRFAIIDARNIAATGWRVPEQADFVTLGQYLDSGAGEFISLVCGSDLKETGTTHWLTPNTGAVNSANFNGRGGGYRAYGVFSFYGIHEVAYLATVTTSATPDTYIVAVLEYNSTSFNYNTVMGNVNGSSIRLIKNTTTLEDGQFGTYTGNDGTVYETVCIGTQEWLAENLRETEFRTGVTIPVVEDGVEWGELTTAACCAYDNDWLEGETTPFPELGYDVKYRIRFPDYFENAWRYEMLFPDYTGEIIPLTGSGNPLMIRCEVAENNPFTVIKSRSCEFEVISITFQQYADIFDANHKIMTRIYKNDTLQFQGWVLQEEYKEPYQLGRYKTKIVSVDGLALLRDVIFEPVPETLGNARWYGMLSILNVISNSLAETGLTLKILDGNILYEDSQDEDHTALRQFYVNRAMFRDGVGYVTCYDAIEICLRSMCCRITQQYVGETVGELCWLIQSIPELGEVHDVVVMSSTGTEEDTETIDDFITITGAKGNPLNVFIDHSAFVEIDEAPHWLRVVSNFGYEENLVKDYFDYVDVNVNSTYSKLYRSLNIETVSGPAMFDGVRFNLGWVDLRKIATMQLAFNWAGMGRMRAALILYGSDSVIYHYNSSAEVFQDVTAPLVWLTYYAYTALRDPDLDIQVCRLDIDASQNLSGRLVLFLLTEIDGTYTGDNTIDLNTLSVAITDNYPKTGETDERAISITNNKVREAQITLSHMGVGSWSIPGWPAFDNSGFPTYALRNEIFIDNGDTIDYPAPLGFHDKGGGDGSLMLSWITGKYYQVYAENRFRLSGTILGQMNLTSMIQVNGRTLLIDAWNFNVKKSTHQIVAMEVAKYDRILADESGNEIVTDDGNNIEV